MKHYIFCAAIDVEKNKPHIEIAKSTKKYLENYWDMNACATGVYEGSTMTDGIDAGNYFIYMEDESMYTLIESCMAFAREYHLRICKLSNK